MRDWESELRNLNAREDAVNRRAIAEYERRRRTRRRLALFITFVVLIIAVIVLIAVLTSRNDGKSDQEPEDRLDSDPLSANNNETPPDVPDWVTEDLLPLNEYSRPGTALPQVNGVVVHYVGNPNTTAKQNRNYFANLAETHETSASSHFVIGLGGEVIQCVPLGEISYCSNKRNEDTIAIECCHPDETGEFTDETVESLVKLLRWLADEYDLEKEDIIRHYDVTGKVCPKWYVDNPDEWDKLRDTVFDGE